MKVLKFGTPQKFVAACGACDSLLEVESSDVEDSATIGYYEFTCGFCGAVNSIEARITGVQKFVDAATEGS